MGFVHRTADRLTKQSRARNLFTWWGKICAVRGGHEKAIVAKENCHGDVNISWIKPGGKNSGLCPWSHLGRVRLDHCWYLGQLKKALWAQPATPKLEKNIIYYYYPGCQDRGCSKETLVPLTLAIRPLKQWTSRTWNFLRSLKLGEGKGCVPGASQRRNSSSSKNFHTALKSYETNLQDETKPRQWCINDGWN